MIKTIQSLLLSASILLIGSTALATSFSSESTYFVKLHFSGEAFDKQVESVDAHIGILTSEAVWRGGKLFWQDVQHTRMERNGDHFFAKAVLRGTSGYEYQYTQGAVVQYWIKFADGTELVTETAMIPEEYKKSRWGSPNEAEELLKQEMERLNSTIDTQKTEAVVVEIGSVS